jgi:stage II sporulation protein AA (anti-sigma F factor antagonist)
MAHGIEVIGGRCTPRARSAVAGVPFDLLQVAVAEPREGVVVVAPVGEVDISTVPALRHAVHEAVETAPRAVVVDLSGLTFCGSTGLVALLEARAHADSRGVGFGTAGGRPIMLRVLAVTGSGPAIGHRESLDKALDDAVVGVVARS